MIDDVSNQNQQNLNQEMQHLVSVTSGIDSVNKARYIKREDLESINPPSKQHNHDRKEDLDDLLNELDDKSDEVSMQGNKQSMYGNLRSIDMDSSPVNKNDAGPSRLTNVTKDVQGYRKSILNLDELESEFNIDNDMNGQPKLHQIDSIDNSNWDI